MIVRRTALVDRSAGQMFDLIEAAENYPGFLPWCHSAQIIERSETVVSADIGIRYRGLNISLRTRNPKQRPTAMTIHLERGPFRRFEGEWRLTPLGADACKVDFSLDYEFELGLMTRLAGPVFAHIANTMVDAFVQRAGKLPLPPAPAA